MIENTKTPMNITINHYPIGDNHPAFIIAEAGVNHNGSYDLAVELIRQAKASGADCVKFQTYKAERVVMTDAPKAHYQLKTTSPQESQLKMLRSLELGVDDFRRLMDVAKSEGILLLSTPYSREDVDLLDDIGFPAFKLASISLVEPSFLAYVARKQKPMIISTGMATLAEVDEAVRAIRAEGNDQFVVLQCTTNYPSRLEDANLRAMVTMRDALNVIVGYSDHTQNHVACMASIALGAHVIEKHFTLDKTMQGPDHSSSADPEEFAELVSLIRQTEAVLGSAIKEPVPVEVENAIGMRRSLVTRVAIKTGDIITEEMLTLKRPATGISAKLLSEVVGRKARNNINIDVQLSWEMLI